MAMSGLSIVRLFLICIAALVSVSSASADTYTRTKLFEIKTSWVDWSWGQRTIIGQISLPRQTNVTVRVTGSALLNSCYSPQVDLGEENTSSLGAGTYDIVTQKWMDNTYSCTHDYAYVAVLSPGAPLSWPVVWPSGRIGGCIHCCETRAPPIQVSVQFAFSDSSIPQQDRTTPEVVIDDKMGLISGYSLVTNPVTITGVVTSRTEVDTVLVTSPMLGTRPAQFSLTEKTPSGTSTIYSYAWAARGIPLRSGENQIVVAAKNAANKTGTDQVVLRFAEFPLLSGGPFADLPCVCPVPARANTGELYDVDTIASGPPGGAPGSSVDFSYNSLVKRSGSSGDGRAHSFEYQAVWVGSGQNRSIKILEPGGSRYDFQQLADGTFQAPDGRFESLTRSTDGALSLLRPDGITIRFNFADANNAFPVAFSDPSGNTTSLSYDSQGRLGKAVSNSSSWKMEFSYGSNGKLKSVRDQANRATQLTYDSNSRLAVRTDAGGGNRTSTYDASGRLSAVYDHRGTDSGVPIVKATYDGVGRATQVVVGGVAHTLSYDRTKRQTTRTGTDGSSVVYSWAPTGHWTGIKDADQGTIRFALNSNYQTVQTTDARGFSTQFEYAPTGLIRSVHASDSTSVQVDSSLFAGVPRVTAITSPSGYVTRFDRDVRGNISQIVGPGQATTALGRDRFGRVTSVTDPVGRTSSLEYDSTGTLSRVGISSAQGPIQVAFVNDAAGNPTEIRDPNGKGTTVAYDSLDRPTSITDPVGASVALTYDKDGRPTSVLDGRSGLTTFEYDGQGRLKATVNPLNHRVERSYDGMGRLSALTKVLGTRRATWSFTYDSVGRLKETVDPYNNKTSRTYDLAGNLTCISRPGGRLTSYLYDSRNRVVEIIVTDGSALGASTLYTYDAESRLSSVCDETGRKTVYSYDSAGRLVTITAPGDLVIEKRYYNSAGELTRTEDGAGSATLRSYDEAGRLKEIVRPDSSKLTFSYDKAGNLVRVLLKADSAHDFTYDDAGRQLSHKDPNSRISSTTYDSIGNVVSEAFPDASGGIARSYTYDLLNRPLTVGGPDGVTSYAYDDSANLVTVTLPDGSTFSRTFDKLDRLSKEVGDGHDLEYVYNAVGHVSSVKLDGVVVGNYEFDLRDRLIRLVDPRVNRSVCFFYDAAGRPIEQTLGNGLKKTMGYGTRGELTSIRVTDAQNQVVLYRSYDHDANLNVTRVSDESGVLEEYTYDSRQRLTKATYRGGGYETFDYDANSNILRHQTNVSDESYTYDPADQLLSVSGTKAQTAEHDLRGNLTKLLSADETRDYVWDSFNRLVEVKVNGVSVARYAYRPDGLRRKVEIPATGVATTTIWSLNNPIAEYDFGTSLKRFFVTGFGLDEVYEGQGATPATSAEIPITDHMGSVLAVADLSGTITRRSSYTAYGDVRSGTAPQGLLPYGHHGARYDVETGWYYHRARYRAPGQMRWASRDPIGFKGGWNLYGFVGGNPLNFVDTLGLRQEWLDRVIEAMRQDADREDAANPLGPNPLGVAQRTTAWLLEGLNSVGDGLGSGLGNLANYGSFSQRLDGPCEKAAFVAVNLAAASLDVLNVYVIISPALGILGRALPIAADAVGASTGGVPRLVVGAGRAEGFPPLGPGDLALNIDRGAIPHVIGDVAAIPTKAKYFGEVYFERVPFLAFTGEKIIAIKEVARVLQSAGRVVIETGSSAPVAKVVAALREAGFTITTVENFGAGFPVRIIATLGGK